MCCTGWVKRKVMQSEESVICDRIFEGIVIVRLVRKNVVVESGIRYGFLNSRVFFVRFLLGLKLEFIGACTFNNWGYGYS